MRNMVIIFALTFCCVNAAFTIDVYNDVEDPLPTEAVNDCDYRACDQLCRRLGFPGGVCVGDRCKCDNFKQVQVPNALDAVALKSCNYQACDQLCRRLGFPGGACVGDRCKCDNFKQAEVQNALEAVALRSCNYQACDQLCRRLGFPGGACVGDRCKCDNFKQAEVENELTLNESEVQEKENAIPAYSRDVVAGNLNADMGVFKDEERPDVIVRSSVNRASCDCDARSCDRYCFRLHYIGGICLTGQCRCYK